MLSTLRKQCRRMIPGKLKMRVFISDAHEDVFNNTTNEELEQIPQDLQLMCDKAFEELTESHFLVEEESRKLVALATAQQFSLGGYSFLAPVEQLIVALNVQKQKQEQLQFYRTVRHNGVASAYAKINEDLKRHVTERDKEKDQMKETEKDLYGENMAQQKNVEWYERENKRLNAENEKLHELIRNLNAEKEKLHEGSACLNVETVRMEKDLEYLKLNNQDLKAYHEKQQLEQGRLEEQVRNLNAENATLKGQVKLWQSATLMIIASAGAGATIWISSPNVLPLTE